MKTLCQYLLLLVLVSTLNACGYHNPNIYFGPHKSIYLAEWKNRTNALILSSKIQRSLTGWFQRSKSITSQFKKDGAELILAGEVISIDLPSLSYGANNTTTEVKVMLRVRYILKEIGSRKILFEVTDEVWTERYLISNNVTTNIDNERKALDIIINDISQKIYRQTIAKASAL